jgi:hypothetical protein
MRVFKKGKKKGRQKKERTSCCKVFILAGKYTRKGKEFYIIVVSIIILQWAWDTERHFLKNKVN